MKLGIIGAGVMGEVIAAALTSKRVFEPCKIMLSDIGRGRLDDLERKHGVRTTLDNEEVVAFADVVLLAVKPQNAAATLGPLAGRFRPDQLLISIMAGVSSATLQRLSGHDRVVRSMPNIPARIGEGMTVWSATPAVPAHLRMVARMIFQAFGQEMEVAQDDQIDAATAVSGSGPAYIFYMAENLMRAAEELGFSPEQAHRLTQQTFRGAMDLWHSSGERAEALRCNVTSKGGTTAAALAYFAAKDTPGIFVGAVRAAYERAGELRALVDEEASRTPAGRE